VPLSTVERLEEFDAEKVERAGGRQVIQYRDHLMPLVPFDTAFHWPAKGKVPVLVLSEGGSLTGLAVGQIVDVITDELKIDLDAGQKGLIGSAVLGGRAMDVIEPRALLQWRHNERPVHIVPLDAAAGDSIAIGDRPHAIAA
jgi:two-component system chemotaxis sensor kinase CheA